MQSCQSWRYLFSAVHILQRALERLRLLLHCAPVRARAGHLDRPPHLAAQTLDALRAVRSPRPPCQIQIHVVTCFIASYARGDSLTIWHRRCFATSTQEPRRRADGLPQDAGSANASALSPCRRLLVVTLGSRCATAGTSTRCTGA